MRIALKLALATMLGVLLVLVFHAGHWSTAISLPSETIRLDDLRFAALLLTVTSLTTGGLCVLLVGRPLNALRDQVRAIAAGSVVEHQPIRATDEIEDLATEVGRMSREVQAARVKIAADAAAREDALEELRHTERLATAGKLASIVAHELGTPLNVISARASMIASGEVTNHELIASARIIVEQSARMSGIIKGVLDSVRKGKPIRSEIGVLKLIRQATGLVSRMAEKQLVDIEVDGDGVDNLLNVDNSRLVQVLTNLITNGIQAMPDGGMIEIHAHWMPASAEEHRAPSGYTRISITDHGAGIAPENLKVIFKPFFTTKSESQGTGLGLAVAEGIVREHGGWLDVESEIGRGSCFSVCLPHGG